MKPPDEILDIGPGDSVPAGLVDEWASLAEKTTSSTYFQTPDWILSWWRHLARMPAMRAAAWRNSDGGLGALVTTASSREVLATRVPIPIARAILAGSGIGAADHTGWLADNDRHDEAALWLREQATQGAILLQNTQESLRPYLERVGAVAIATSACPQLNLKDVAQLRQSKRYRRIGKYRRRLEREGVSFEFLTPDQLTEQHLEAFIRLHAARVGMTEARTTFTDERLPFHLSLLQRSSRRRGPSAVVAYAGDELVSFSYGFLYMGTWSGYQLGWNPAFAKYSIGTVSVAEAIERTAALGLDTFDFLRGSESWKYKFRAADHYDTTWLLGNRVGAQLLRWTKRVKMSVRQSAGRRR